MSDDDDTWSIASSKREALQLFHTSRFVQVYVCECLVELYSRTHTLASEETDSSLLYGNPTWHPLRVPDYWKHHGLGMLALKTFNNPRLPMDVLKGELVMQRSAIPGDTVCHIAFQKLHFCDNDSHGLFLFFTIPLASSTSSSFAESSSTSASSTLSPPFFTVAAASARKQKKTTSKEVSRDVQLFALHVGQLPAYCQLKEQLKEYTQRHTITTHRDKKMRARMVKQLVESTEKVNKACISAPHTFRHIMHVENFDGDSSSPSFHECFNPML